MRATLCRMCVMHALYLIQCQPTTVRVESVGCFPPPKTLLMLTGGCGVVLSHPPNHGKVPCSRMQAARTKPMCQTRPHRGRPSSPTLRSACVQGCVLLSPRAHRAGTRMGLSACGSHVSNGCCPWQMGFAMEGLGARRWSGAEVRVLKQQQRVESRVKSSDDLPPVPADPHGECLSL